MQMQMQIDIEPNTAAPHVPVFDFQQPRVKQIANHARSHQSCVTTSASSSDSPLPSDSPLSDVDPSLPEHSQHVKNESQSLSEQPFERVHLYSEEFKAAKVRYQQEKLAKQQASSKNQAFTPISSSINMVSSQRDTAKTPGLKFSNGSARWVREQSISPSQQIPSQDRPFFGPSQRHFDESQAFNPNGRGPTNGNDWSSWVEVGVKLFDLPTIVTTLDIWKRFSQEGNVIYVELFEDRRGQRDGKACVRFSPPPARPFWESNKIHLPLARHGTVAIGVQMEPKRRTFYYPSPINANVKYPEVMGMHAESVEFGTLLDSQTMMKMCTVHASRDRKAGVEFRQDMQHREITVEFEIHIQDPRAGLRKYERRETMQFRIPFSQLQNIRQYEEKDKKLVLVVSLNNPPKFFKQLSPVDTHDDKAAKWGGNDAWYRQTDVVYAPNTLKKSPLSLRKIQPIIDLGSWTTYRFVFDRSRNNMAQFNLMCRALQDYNILIQPCPTFRIAGQYPPGIWDLLDRSSQEKKQDHYGLNELGEDSTRPMSFLVRYQLEVCISQGLLNEHNLKKQFVDQLVNMKIEQAQDLLEYVANQGKVMWDPMTLFDLLVGDSSTLRSRIPHYCVYVRSATVTPTTVLFHTPVPDISNRVIRQFSQYSDRFLRVKFTEEKPDGKIYATDKETMNEVFTRVKRVLTNGILIGDRKYEFLACGNSQFREHGAYFFAPLPNLPTRRIREWMGLFTEIKTVPLYSARLGQCFSTTRAVTGAKTEVVEISDVERNGFNFTDGVGRISNFLANLAASELGLMRHTTEAPSVFQIRVGGCKGILAVSPTSEPREIHLRKSQYKFPATHEGLEIIRWSQFACANLNRQLILVLSALGVPDGIFSQKLRLQLADLEKAMTDEKTALDILQRDIDYNQMTLTVAGMILDGFQKTEEIFTVSLLQLWRAWSIKYLKEKARITIAGGALLLGCVDEYAILRGHFENAPKPHDDAPIEEKARHIPEVFVQVSKGLNGKPKIILGPMLIARNPSLHPGDVRVVCGIDIPRLHHLRNVVVLPQTGDRDVASMCSGGDLDGDDFLVIWDQDLIPREWNHEPMDYSRPFLPPHGSDIGINDLTTFFVTYMKNDSVSCIAIAHLENGDYLDQGVKDEKCLKLAALHSMAVDYVKTGQPATMTRDLKAPKRPHFMDNTHVRADRVYVSKKVLGQLYDQVERVDFVPAYALPFDKRILDAYESSAGLLEAAAEIKMQYDASMRRIMAQYEIKTEFEIWSTFVLQHTTTLNAFKFHEQLGQISGALKDQFQGLCRARAGGRDFRKLGPFVAAMYKVTSVEMGQALAECQQTQFVGGVLRPLRRMTAEHMPLISFPWLFPDVLGKIANSYIHTGNESNPETAYVSPSTIELARDALKPTDPKKLRPIASMLDVNDDLQTAHGVTRRGQKLELFEDADKVEPKETVYDPKLAQILPSSSGHSLVDITPPGSSNGALGQAGPYSSHSSGLAISAEGSHKDVGSESEGSTEEMLRRSPSSESEQTEDIEHDQQGVRLEPKNGFLSKLSQITGDG